MAKHIQAIQMVVAVLSGVAVGSTITYLMLSKRHKDYIAQMEKRVDFLAEMNLELRNTVEEYSEKVYYEVSLEEEYPDADRYKSIFKEVQPANLKPIEVKELSDPKSYSDDLSEITDDYNVDRFQIELKSDHMAFDGWYNDTNFTGKVYLSEFEDDPDAVVKAVRAAIEELEDEAAGREIEALTREYVPDGPTHEVITMESYVDDNPHYDKLTLVYYSDGILYEQESGDLIINVEYVVGTESLEHFGDDPRDPDTIYVRNNKTGCDFEIQKVDEVYEDHIDEETEYPEKKEKVVLRKMRPDDS